MEPIRLKARENLISNINEIIESELPQRFDVVNVDVHIKERVTVVDIEASQKGKGGFKTIARFSQGMGRLF